VVLEKGDSRSKGQQQKEKEKAKQAKEREDQQADKEKVEQAKKEVQDRQKASDQHVKDLESTIKQKDAIYAALVKSNVANLAAKRAEYAKEDAELQAINKALDKYCSCEALLLEEIDDFLSDEGGSRAEHLDGTVVIALGAALGSSIAMASYLFAARRRLGVPERAIELL